MAGENTDRELPRVYGDLKEHRGLRGGAYAMVSRCPYCAGKHTHGWNTGPRIAHCHKGSYFLVCDGV